MHAQHRFALLIGMLSALLCANAQAGAGLTLEKLTWDPRQPDSTPYQDVPLDSSVSSVINLGWTNASEPVRASVVQELTRPDRFKRGVTLYNVDLRLPPGPQVTVVPQGGANGSLRLFLPRAEMDFTATHPLTSRATDARFRVAFDLAVDVNFRLNGRMHPPIEVLSAKAQPVNVNVKSRNASATAAIIVTDIVSSLTHDDALADVIKQGVAKSAVDVTGQITAQLRGAGRLLDVPPGYQYNGGRVDPGRLIVAAWQAMPLPRADVAVRVTWDGRWGRLLPNCEAVRLRVTMPYAPPPLGQARHIDSDYYPTATPATVQVGKDFQCYQSIAGVRGVKGTLQYKEQVIEAGHSRTPGYSRSARAVPVNWSNPLVVGDAARGSAELRLDVRESMHDGSHERDPAQEVLARKPGDPVERGKAAIDPAQRITTTANPAIRPSAAASGVAKGSAVLPASRIGNASRVTDELNPQPLPPGPSPDRGKVSAGFRALAPTAIGNAPASSLQGH